jgi:UDP-GlcNAc:undecaprenyl-phosphate/decaprenyl-phosphate GlcNAc-1-phosphate transferase
MLVGAVIAFAVTAVSIRLSMAPAVRIGLVDHPNHRKRHEGAIPLVGGLALLVGFAAGWALAPSGLGTHWFLLLGTGVIAAVGLFDDLYHVSSRIRLAVQLLVALAVVLGGFQIDSLGNLLGTGAIHLGWLSVPFTVLCIVMMINAINMLDGADGLAGSVTLFASSGFAILALIAGKPETAFVALLLTSALLGFLLFNLRSPWLSRARVFMGDSGSMALGFLLALIAIGLTQQEGSGIAPISVAWMLLLPAADILSVFARRLWWGRSPMAADRSHFHHVLLRAGLSVSSTVWIIGLNQLALVAVAIALHLGDVPEPLQFVLAAAVFVAYCSLSLNSRRFLRVMHPRHRRQSAVEPRRELSRDCQR